MKTAKKCCKLCAHHNDESLSGAQRCIVCLDSGCLSKWQAKQTAVRRLAILAAAVAVVGQTGCASVWVYRQSDSDLRAIRGMALKDGAGVAVDVGALNTLAHNWPVQLGAAVLDIGAGVGVYKIGEANGWWGNKSSKGENAPPAAIGHDYNTVTVTGNGNTTQVIMYPVTIGAQ